MIIKTSEDVRSEMLETLDNYLPNFDLTTGTPERDLFVEAPLEGQLNKIWEEITYVGKLHSPITYVNDLQTQDIETYMGNYDIAPYDATYSEGVVIFYRNSLPTENIIIPNGTVVKTKAADPIEFAVQGNYTIYYSIASSYYNANTQRWEIQCAVKALNAGPDYRAGSNTVTSMANNVTGIDGVTNTSAITGGTDAEAVEDALLRVVELFQGRGLASTQGLQNYIRPYVEALNIVRAGDAEMLRDEGLGGMIDFYVIGETITSATDTVQITSTGLSNPIDVSYTSMFIKIINQPVKELTSLLINGIVIAPSYYTLTKDMGILSKSTQASDKVSITSTGIYVGLSFNTNDVVEINYTYNSLLSTIETDLYTTDNHYMNRDYLVREMTAVTTNIYMAFKETANQDWNLVATTVETNVSSYINSIKTIGALEFADVINVAKSIKTVDNVNTITMTMTPVGGGTITAQKDITFSKNEYPVAGTITLARWTGL